MTVSSKRPRRFGVWLLYAVAVCGMCCLTFWAYMFLSQGLVDDVLSEHFQRRQLSRLDVALTAEPPDVNFLISHIRSRDWLVATGATEYVGQLREEDKLTSEQADAAVEKLWKALAAGGHWWRFGWTDEGDYDIFQGTALDVLAGFGNRYLPRLLAAGSSRSRFEREAFCWVSYLTLDQGTASRTALDEMGILQKVIDLAQNDPDSWVRLVCNDAQQRIEELP